METEKFAIFSNFATRVLVFLFLAVGVPEVSAHARLTRSIPAQKARLVSSPASIDLWFNELLEDGFNTVELFPAAELKQRQHTNLLKQKPALDTKDRTHLTIPTGTLAAGEYVVEWRVLSKDGHSAPGRLTFTVLEKK